MTISIASASNYLGHQRDVKVSDCPSKSYRWGVVDLGYAGKPLGALWFKTRKDADGFANINRRGNNYAIARAVLHA